MHHRQSPASCTPRKWVRQIRVRQIWARPLWATTALLALAACGGGGGALLPLGPVTVATESAFSASGSMTFQATPPPEVASGTLISWRSGNSGTGSGHALGGSSCTGDVDYINQGGATAVVNGRTAALAITLCPNAKVEPNETFDVLVDWQGSTVRATGRIINDAKGGLNDTGAHQCLDSSGTLVACGNTTVAGQDAQGGRDTGVLTSGNIDGRLGFAFANRSGGCVEDLVTGLLWHNAATAAPSLADASARAVAANGSALCGYTDWRLPSAEELLGLVDAGASSAPRIDAWFAGTPSSAFWTSTLYAGDTRAAWMVDFDTGALAYDTISNRTSLNSAVRIVRGNSPAYGACTEADPARFTDHANGTVTDQATGLMWQQCADGLSGSGCASGSANAHSTFSAALARAGSVNADSANAGRGYGDWRVPNRNELASLVHRACELPAIQRTRFPATPSASFWTSTPAGANRAWYVDFNEGSIGPGGVNGARLLRLVRAGQ